MPHCNEPLPYCVTQAAISALLGLDNRLVMFCLPPSFDIGNVNAGRLQVAEEKMERVRMHLMRR